MRKCISIFLTLVLFLTVPYVAHAETRGHFDDGNEEVAFEDYGISLNLPSEWGYANLDDKCLAMYPEDNRDLFLLLTFQNLSSSDLSDALEVTFLKEAVEKSIEGVFETSQDGQSEMYELSNGSTVALCSYFNADMTAMSISSRVGDCLLVLSLISPPDGCDEEYFDDIDSILISAKELES